MWKQPGGSGPEAMWGSEVHPVPALTHSVIWESKGKRGCIRQLVHTAWGPLTPLGVSKAGIEFVNWCQYPSKLASRHCLSSRRPSRLMEMSSACPCSGLTSPLLRTGTKRALMPSPLGMAVICVLVWFQNRGPRRKNHERCPCWKKRSGAHLIASLWALADKRQEPQLFNVWVSRGSCK